MPGFVSTRTRRTTLPRRRKFLVGEADLHGETARFRLRLVGDVDDAAGGVGRARLVGFVVEAAHAGALTQLQPGRVVLGDETEHVDLVVEIDDLRDLGAQRQRLAQPHLHAAQPALVRRSQHVQLELLIQNVNVLGGLILPLLRRGQLGAGVFHGPLRGSQLDVSHQGGVFLPQVLQAGEPIDGQVQSGLGLRGVLGGGFHGRFGLVAVETWDAVVEVGDLLALGDRVALMDGLAVRPLQQRDDAAVDGGGDAGETPGKGLRRADEFHPLFEDDAAGRLPLDGGLRLVLRRRLLPAAAGEGDGR